MVKPSFTAGESERYKSERGEFAKMDVGQLPALLQQQAQFFQQTVEQQTNTLAQAMNAMADMVRTLQADRVPVKEKELMTTKRAFTMLPNYSGKV